MVSFSTAICFLLMSLSSYASCNAEPVVEYSNYNQIKKHYFLQNKKVLTFVGYSSLGYQDISYVFESAGKVLDLYSPNEIIVNIGATSDGIGQLYRLAKSRGFLTIGIVSSKAKEGLIELSPCVDYVFYIEDDFWGGIIDSNGNLSPTSEAIVGISDMLVGIGGDTIARDELIAAKYMNKVVSYIPAEMNHKRAIERAEKKGENFSATFSGAANEEFLTKVR